MKTTVLRRCIAPVAGLVLLATGGVLEHGARAHAVLSQTVPEDRTVLADPPGEIVLRFNEPVRPVAVRLLDQDGTPVPLSAPVAVDRDVRLPLPPGLPAGSYVVSWRVTSADSHPVGGAFMFAVGSRPTAWRTDIAAAGPEDRWRSAIVVNRALFLAGLLLSIGAAVHLLLVGPHTPDGRRAVFAIAMPASIVAVITAVAGIGLQGAAIADLAPSALFGPQPWWIGAGSSKGLAAAFAIAGTLILAAGLSGTVSVARRNAVILGAAVALAGFALSGHAATIQPAWLFLPVLLLHVLLAAFWIGSLLPLLRALRDSREDAFGRLRRFSRLAVVAVPVLLAAGVVLALAVIGDWADLTRSAYGLLLLVKAALAALMVALAAANRLFLTPRLADGAARAARTLRLTIGTETGIAFAVLAVTAALSQTAPPRSLAAAGPHDHAAGSPGYSATLRSRGRAAAIEVSPAVAGRNGIVVHIVDDRGQRVEPVEMSLRIASRALGIEPIARRMTATPGGGFSHVGPEFALPGTWQLQVEALVTEFDKLVFETDVPIRPAQAPNR